MSLGVREFGIGVVVGAIVVAVAWAGVAWFSPSTSQRAAPPQPVPLVPMATAAEAALPTDDVYAIARQRLYGAKETEKARRTFERLLERDLDPDMRVQILTDLGIAHRVAGDHEASLEVLTAAMDAVGIGDPVGAQAAFQIMWTYKCMGDLPKADSWGRQVLAARPESRHLEVAAHRALGLIARELGDEGRARRELETALKIAGDDPRLQPAKEEIRTWLPRRE